MTVTSPSNVQDQRYEVTPLELFFDLVFAVSQLSHHLLEHVSWRGAAEMLVLLLAVFAVWFHTSWAATMIPAHRSRTLWMILAVMLLSLFMNASVTGAFAASGGPSSRPFCWLNWAAPLGRSRTLPIRCSGITSSGPSSG